MTKKNKSLLEAKHKNLYEAVDVLAKEKSIE